MQVPLARKSKGHPIAAKKRSADELSEADHRIGNSLSIVAGLLRAQLRALPKAGIISRAEIEAILEGSSAKIDAIGRLHRLVMGTGIVATVDLCDYLREVVAAAQAALIDGHGPSIRCDLKATDAMPVKRAAAIGLFVSEALINSLKHAGADRIRIGSDLSRNGVLLIEIRDTGRPGPKAIVKGTGLRLMQVLASELDGAAHFERTPTGFVVRLMIPSPATTLSPPLQP
jgi:two-component sensor histidine kinase